jgi:hypothetical protein
MRVLVARRGTRLGESEAGAVREKRLSLLVSMIIRRWQSLAAPCR